MSVATKRVSLENRQDIVIYKFIPAHSTLKLEITWLLPLHNGRRYDYFKIISRVAFIVPVYANTSDKEKFLLIIRLHLGKFCYAYNEIF